MELDKNKVKTVEESDETPMDKANERVEAEMKVIESAAKQRVAQSLQDKKLERDAEQLKQEGEKELRDLDREV
jgi:hypothetical protein